MNTEARINISDRAVEVLEKLIDNTENPAITGYSKDNKLLHFGIAVLDYIVDGDDSDWEEYFYDLY